MENMQNKKNDIRSFGYAISETSHYIKISILQVFKEKKFKITPEQFFTLYILYQENGMYQRQLAKKLLKDRPNITRLVDILEKKEFIYRESDPTNRRITKLFITEKGKTQVENILPVFIGFKDIARKNMPDEDIDHLIEILFKIQNNLKAYFKIQI